MLTLTVDPRRWFQVHTFSRNPLVRGSDRLEALIIVLAILVSLLAVPVAGAVGTAVYDARRQQYLTEVTQRAADPITNSQAKVIGVSGVRASSETKLVGPPTSTAGAAADGVCTGTALLLGVVAALAALVALTRLRLSRIRNAAWERELRCLANENGGRNKGSFG